MFSGFEMSQLKTIMFMASLIWFKWQTELKVDINVNIKSTCHFYFIINSSYWKWRELKIIIISWMK